MAGLVHYGDRHGALLTLEILAPLAILTVLAGELDRGRARREGSAAAVRAGRRRSARVQLAAVGALFVGMMFVVAATTR